MRHSIQFTSETLHIQRKGRTILTTYLLKSLAKNTAGPAKSAGSPVLPSGILPSIYAFFSGSARSASLSWVRMVPGSRALQRMLYLPRAQAHDCIRLSTPALVGV